MAKANGDTSDRRGVQARARIARRKGDAKSSTQAGRTRNVDMAGMLLHDSVSDCQPETRTASHSFGSEKRIVDLNDVFRRDTDAVIRDFNSQQSFFTIARRQGDAAIAVRDGIAGVEDQVRENLLQLH